MDASQLGHLLPLFILLPLLAAGMSVVISSSWVRRAMALIVPAIATLGSLLLILYLGDPSHTILADPIGGYPGGIAIPLAADTFTAVMLLATSFIAFCANYFADSVGETQARFYPALTLMLMGGVWGALLTTDLFNLFVFIEVMLMPSYGLLAMTGTWARLASARMFVVVNLITSSILVAGVALVYAVVGTTNLAALAGAGGPRAVDGFAEGISGSYWQLLIPLSMIMLALAIKGAVAPIHTWLPRSYPSTSPAVMALFSGLHTKVAVYAIIRIYMVVFEGDQRWSWLIVALMGGGMIIGAYAGMAEYTMRAVISYQMVNGIPMILLSLAFLKTNPGFILSAAIFYMIHHIVTAGALIMSAGAIEETYGTGRLRILSGIMNREPLVATIFAAASLSIVGFPPFSGMWGKLMMIIGIAEDGGWISWVSIAIVILSSIGALFSMLFLWKSVFWGPPLREEQLFKEGYRSQEDADKTLSSLRIKKKTLIPSALLVCISFAMFVGADPVFTVLDRASSDLINTTNFVHSVLGTSPEGTVLPGTTDPLSDHAIGVVLEPEGEWTTQEGER